jgi:hypothetical protein
LKYYKVLAKRRFFTRFEVLTVLTLEIAVFWNVTHIAWQMFTDVSEEHPQSSG